MRELTLPEISSVAGGRRLQTVVVIGRRPSPSPGFVPTFGPTIPTFEPPVPFGGGGGGPSIPEEEHCTADMTDSAATDLESMIDARAAADGATNTIGDETKEYSGLIFQNADGSITTSPLMGGTSGSSFTSAFSIPSGATIVGIVHNHPPVLPDPSIPPGDPDPLGDRIDLLNQYPTHDDWDQLASIATAANPNPSTFIQGPDGVLREFSLSERSTFDRPELTPQFDGDRRAIDGSAVPPSRDEVENC